MIDDKTKDAVVVDPAHPPEVLPVLKGFMDSREVNTLAAIVNTHQLSTPPPGPHWVAWVPGTARQYRRQSACLPMRLTKTQSSGPRRR